MAALKHFHATKMLICSIVIFFFSSPEQFSLFFNALSFVNFSVMAEFLTVDHNSGRNKFFELNLMSTFSF